MAYINAIQYSSGSAMREAARAVHQRLMHPVKIANEPAEKLPKRYSDLPAFNGHVKTLRKKALARFNERRRQLEREERMREAVEREAAIKANAERLVAESKARADALAIELTNIQIEIAQRPDRITLEYLASVTSAYFDLLPSDLKGFKRDHSIVPARRAFCYIAKETLGKTWMEMARTLQKNHTSCYNAYHKAIHAMMIDAEFRDRVCDIRDFLQGKRSIVEEHSDV